MSAELDAVATSTAARRLLRGTSVVLALLAITLSVLFGVIAGPAGAAGAVIGVGLVFVLFGGSALLLTTVAGRFSQFAVGVLAIGAFSRLALYGVVLSMLSSVPWLHRASLAIATAVAVGVTLMYELRALARLPRLFWVDADISRPQPVPHATRS